MKDKKGSLINFDFSNGLYTVPKQLENGYLAIGKQKVEFHRVGGGELAMPEPNQNPPATVPEQPEAKPPLRKSMPVVIALVVIVGLIGIANLSSLFSGNKKAAPHERAADASGRAERAAGLQLRDAAADAGPADAEERQRQQELAAAMQQLQAEQDVPGPEAAGAPPMTAAQRAAIYGDSPNAPQRTSNVSQAQAEAKQKALANEKAAAGRAQQRHRRYRLRPCRQPVNARRSSACSEHFQS